MNNGTILILNYEFPPIGGGGGVASKILSKGFVDLGYKVVVITSLYKGLPKYECIDGCEIYRVWNIGRNNKNSSNIICMFSFLVGGFFTGIKLFKKYKFNIINTHFILPTGPLGYFFSKIYGVRNIISLHGGDIYDPTKKLSPHRWIFFRFIVRFLLNNSYAIVAQSKYTKENVKKYYGNCNIKIIPLPFEMTFFKKKTRFELGFKENDFIVISIGRFIEIKGFIYLIKAILLLKNKFNIKLLLLGDGPDREYLENFVDKNGLNNIVQFLGNIYGAEKFIYLSVSDIYILSSISESFGIVLQEAMSVGLPIISTNIGGMKDFLIEGKNCLFVNPGVPEEIKEKILFLYKNKEYSKKLSENNLVDIKQFDLKNITKKYIDLF